MTVHHFPTFVPLALLAPIAASLHIYADCPLLTSTRLPVLDAGMART